MSHVHDVIIIGSGPAGLTAGIYTGRAKLNPLIIEGDMPGGQLMTTTFVENWPGDVSTKGPDIIKRMHEHAKAYGASFLADTVTRLDLSQQPYTVYTQGGETLKTECVIIATGSSHKKLQVPGEQEYWGKGVTTCATCDGPFYSGRPIVIAGGGNTAMTEASFMLNFASHITVVQNLDQISANDPIKDSVIGNEKVTIMLSSTITEIRGDEDHVREIVVQNSATGKQSVIPTDAVFVAIGFKPNTAIAQGELETDSYGYIVRHNHTLTSKEGVFACGDVSDFYYQQAVTAAGEGCMAALDCERYLRGKKTLQK